MCCMMGHGTSHAHDHGAARDEAAQPPLMEILRRRYAAGEITRPQFEEMKATLGLSRAEDAAPVGGHDHAWEAG